MDMYQIICPVCQKIIRFQTNGTWFLSCLNDPDKPFKGHHFYIGIKAATKRVDNFFVKLGPNTYYQMSPNDDVLTIDNDITYIQRLNIDVDHLDQLYSYLQELVKLKAFL